MHGDEILPHISVLGEHTAEVVQSLGISAAEIEVLRRDGIV
jgi:hypothetical protein